jgi:hypothetical protein
MKKSEKFIGQRSGVPRAGILLFAPNLQLQLQTPASDVELKLKVKITSKEVSRARRVTGEK